MTPDPASHGDTLRAGTLRLREAGFEYAREDARALLVWACDCSTIDLISREHEPIPSEAARRYHAAIDQRAGGRPLQHIVGHALFYGLRLKSDARALVPRSDSECVVELALEYLPHGASCRIADLGTGTGALLAALLTARPDTSGTAVEASDDACALARENFAQLGLQARADLFNGAWGEWHGWGKCDLIISNPPYIASGDIPDLAEDVRAHDPLSALDGGPDGLDAYRDLLAHAAQMQPGAFLVLEIGHDQKTAVCQLLEAAGFGQIETRRDLGGHDRVVSGKRI